VQPRPDSRIADAFGSRLEQIVRRLSREHFTLGIILLVLGVFAFQISPWLAWFTIGTGVLLLTWHSRMPGTYRGLLYFIALLPVLHWFNSINEFLFHEDAVTGMMLSRESASPLELVYGLVFAAAAIGGLILVIRHRPRGQGTQAAAGGSGNRQNAQASWSNVPARSFADVGGMDDQKRRITAIVQNRLHPERFKQHGVVQNGILLYGPRGTGKTFLAEATAGEFKINYWYAKPTSLVERWIGSSEANIREIFARAYAHRPVLFFLDEIDSIGTQRQQLGRDDDRGGGARLYNSVVTELMQCIDQYRGSTGFILMAATNFYEGLDEALVRDMRFDEKIRVDLPDEAARAQILFAQLSKRLWTPFPVESFAERTPGWSAAKLSGLVNKAASVAALENRRIEERDLQQAFDESGGQDRPLMKAVDWCDLVLSAAVERDLRNLIRLMDARESEKLKVPLPTGLLLVGPAGTGKTSIAHLIATQTRRSFYAIAPADVPAPEKLAQVFGRAREHSPSILFIDEIDGLLPRGDSGYYMGQHQIQIVEQALMLMSQLDPGNQVFLVGTTNHIDHIDPRVLRGGRFTEKIEVGVPDDQGYLRLIGKYLGPIPLAAGLTCHDLLARLRGISPADLQGLVNTAKRMAMNRMKASDEALPPLNWEDFEQALERTRSGI
jgi:transitional endoplasmic reticulum ATPase